MRKRAWLAARAARATLLQYAPDADSEQPERHGATHGIDALQAQRELLALVREQERHRLEQPLREAQTRQQLPPTAPSPRRTPPALQPQPQPPCSQQPWEQQQQAPQQAGAGGEVAAVNLQEELEAVGSAPALLRLCSQDPLEAVGSDAEPRRRSSRYPLNRPSSLERVSKSLKRNLGKLKHDEQDLDEVIWIVRMSGRFAPAPNVEPLWEEMHEMLDLSVRKNRSGSVVTECCATIAIKRLYLMSMVEGCVSVLGSELKSILEDVEAGRSEDNFVFKAQVLQEQDRRASAALVSKARQLEDALTAWLTDNTVVSARAAARIAARIGVSRDDVEFCLARLIKVGRVRQGKRARTSTMPGAERPRQPS